MSQEESNNSQTISVQENIIKRSFKEFLLGILDSLQIFTIYPVISKSEKITNNLKNCLLLNGFLFIGSIIMYHYLIDPVINYFQSTTIGYFLLIGKYFYYIFWLMPVFVICNVINSFWIDEIYLESLVLVEETNIKVEGQGFITALANQIERMIIVISFLIFITILNKIPGLIILKYMTISILNSLYVFEYILLQKYLRNYKSIMYFIEYKFFYFLGYGLLLTIMVNTIDSMTTNSAIFLIAFPFFLITSVKVNNERFKNFTEIKNSKLTFFYVISKFYDAGLIAMNFIINKRYKK
jgi:etoposide-induced 2.4 mRNA